MLGFSGPVTSEIFQQNGHRLSLQEKSKARTPETKSETGAWEEAVTWHWERKDMILPEVCMFTFTPKSPYYHPIMAWKLFEFEDQGKFNLICLLENM